MSTYWLGLGANLGDRAAALQGAVDALAAAGVVVDAVSPVYETAPQDLVDQPAFLNAVVRAQAHLDPAAMLALAKRVEQRAGRGAGGPRYGPRPLDVDLLVWDGGAFRSDDPDLAIPHLRLAERRFALVPLADVAPGMVLPDGRPVQELLGAIAPGEQPVQRATASLSPRP